jgi:hypothetical protein
MTHNRDAIAAALNQKCGTHFLNEIGTIVRRGAIDTDTDRDTSLLEIADRTAARRKHLVAAGAMADCRSRSRQACHLIGVEMDSVCEPRPRAKPTAVVEVVQWPEAIDLLAIAVLILGFGEVSMPPNTLLFRRSLAPQGVPVGGAGNRRAVEQQAAGPVNRAGPA